MDKYFLPGIVYALTLKVSHGINLHSIDLWLQSVSPLCINRITLFSKTFDLYYENMHGIPVVISPYVDSDRHVFGGWFYGFLKIKPLTIANLKSPCVVNILYFETRPYGVLEPLMRKINKDADVLNNWINFNSVMRSKGGIFQKQSPSLILYSKGIMQITHLLNKRYFQMAHKIGFFYINKINSNTSSLNSFKLHCKCADQVLTTVNISIASIPKVFSIIETCFTQTSGFVMRLFADEDSYIDTLKELDRPREQLFTEMFKFLNASLLYSNETLLPSISLNKLFYTKRSETLLMTSSPEIKIFTCYVKEHVSFYMYISAFERTV